MTEQKTDPGDSLGATDSGGPPRSDATPTPEEDWGDAPISPVAWILSRIVAPVAVVGLGVACTGVLFALQPSAERSEPPARVPEVSVRMLSSETLPATIRTSGVVTPAKQISLTAEVQGKIIRQSEDLVPGGRFAKGDLLVQLDTRDYAANVAAQERALQQAELELKLERNRGRVAEREWELLGDSQTADPELALRKPQLKTAEKAYEAAEAALTQAKANLGRTRVTAPFDSIVVTESVDVGQIVGPSAPIATLVGTDELWVQISLPVERLAGIEIPGVTSDLGSPATVTQKLGQGGILRDGKVERLMGQLDPQTRTAQLLVSIPEPLEGDGLPMLPGAWVDVSIEGRSLEDTWEIPRTALVQGEYAWVVDQEQTLRKRTVEVGWRNPETVIVTDGFEQGDRIVTSPLTLPVDGQLVKPIEESG